MPDVIRLPMVWKTPWWKRALIIIGSALFVVGSLYTFFQPEAQAAGPKNLILLLAAAFFGFVLWKSLTVPSITLVADEEGLDPMFLSKKHRRKLLWGEIAKVETVTQKYKGSRTKMLAITLHTPEDFGMLHGGAVVQMMAGKSMSDGGTAHLYIPSMRLSESVEKVAEKLLRLREQQVDTVRSVTTL
jgi:hypothetical protein